jgi:ABC-type antimicrobial peptide transport system permease subunit
MSNADVDNEECRLSSRMKSALYSISSQLNVDEYNNLDTEDQCLILLNKIDTALQLMKYDMKTSKFNNTNNTNLTNYDDDGFEIDLDNMNISNNKYNHRIENEVLVKAKTLEDELRLSLQSMDNLQMLKNKNSNLFKKLNSEKQQRSVLEKFVESQNKKIKLLILHIEKLMKTLKIESNKTMRSLETNRHFKLEEANLQMKIEKQVKIIAAQNK